MEWRLQKWFILQSHQYYKKSGSSYCRISQSTLLLGPDNRCRYVVGMLDNSTLTRFLFVLTESNNRTLNMINWGLCVIVYQLVTSPVWQLSIRKTVNGHRLIFSQNLWRSGRLLRFFLRIWQKPPNSSSSDLVRQNTGFYGTLNKTFCQVIWKRGGGCVWRKAIHVRNVVCVKKHVI